MINSQNVEPSDADMLDWLDSQGSHYKWKVQIPSDYPNVRDCVFVSRNTSEGHKTIREAIADRMKKQNECEEARTYDDK